ncbi:ABC transporter substrate-binding protein [Venenivibrio stagnispumantis]|uniref:Peptide/nickel transport system substrate-binding protein n=1 Tax=Venenivibrio stagnispumantis TaxID=407998 RepID=A0AA45WKK4_9AQUI|nr:ABC transporter substrate-binding protein [Venenivibrio stagnispumantis]MCW4572996.1 ABC transporter substrate-binding protein [Venenivibrio stagnispumantis]SMP07897.1 peptide/nickel transport system substrate-binding protein [Venenivibrio stagnispumantis]
MNKLIYTGLAFLLIIVLFLPVYFISSSSDSSNLSVIKKVNLEEFNIVIGKETDLLQRALSSDAKTFNPVMATETSSTAVIGALFNGLTKTDVKTLLPEPDLAERWEKDKTGTIWRFYLRDAKWFDGKPVSADDVVFTYNQIYYNKNIPTSARDVLTIEGKPFIVKKIDDKTVEFILPKPFAPFLNAVSQPILPKHILEEYVKNNTFTSVWSVNTPPEKLIGTGAYKLSKYITGQMVIYERNPYYWEKDEEGKPLPYIKQIKAQIIKDPDVALVKFLSGEIDIYGVRPSDLPKLLPKAKEKDFTIYNLGATPSTTFICFNQNPNAPIEKYKLKWFQNQKFRQAISYAVDRKGIINIAYNGLAYPLYTAVTPAERRLFDENFYPKYEYNLKKAKEILLSIGFKEGKDGFLYDKEGNKLSFNLITNAGSKEREIIGNILKEDLKKIGIEVNFQAIDFNNLVSKLMSSGDWDAVIIGLTGTLDPYFGQNVWLSSGHMHLWNPKQKKPATDWEAKVDELFIKASTELNQKERDRLYKEAFKIIGQQQPMIFIAAPEELVAVKNKFKNVFPTVWGWYKDEYMFIP